jgi:hypothetical protein
MIEGHLLSEADKLLEAGKLEEAYQEYILEDKITQAAFVTLLAGDIQHALELYLQVPHSSAKRWGLFLCDFFINPQRMIPSPGVLSFRLYFEATFYYCKKFGLTDYVNNFVKYADSLNQIYPEYLHDMEKVNKCFDN